MVMENCRRHNVPFVITLGGGYADPIERTAEAHANTFRTAAELSRLHDAELNSA
jgi:acetoin utilization deacetylase AcuC-like enzyme